MGEGGGGGRERGEDIIERGHISNVYANATLFSPFTEIVCLNQVTVAEWLGTVTLVLEVVWLGSKPSGLF